MVTAVGGWAGFTLGLLNVYPSLFPWRTPTEKLAGIAMCALLAGLAARVTHLVSEGREDVLSLAMTFGLLLIIAVTVVARPDGAHPAPAGGTVPGPGPAPATSRTAPPPTGP